MSQLSPDAKTAIALANEGIGGLPALIKWAKSSASARMTFYTQLYAKLIPLNVAASVDVNINESEEAKQKLQDAFERLLEAEALTIEHDPQPSAAENRGAPVLSGPADEKLRRREFSEPVPASPAATPASPIIDFAAEAKRRAMQPSYRPPIMNTAAAEMTTTEKYFGWVANSDSDRMRLKDWGPG